MLQSVQIQKILPSFPLPLISKEESILFALLIILKVVSFGNHYQIIKCIFFLGIVISKKLQRQFDCSKFILFSLFLQRCFLVAQIIKSRVLNEIIRYLLQMKRTHNQSKSKTKAQHFALQIRTSEYSRLYALYLKTQYHAVQQFIKQFVKLPFCNDFYLKYPLEGLLKGICKKLLLNVYELTVFGYFLSQVEWKLDHCIYMNLAEVFPNIIHVNEPTDTNTLKQLSMFLYFSSYSVKEFLNDDLDIVKQEMIKIFPQFQHLQAYWTSTQQTVGQVLNPKALNSFFKSISKIGRLVDFNTCVDKILQISPCYDITARNQKQKELPTFGYMITGNMNYNHNLQNNVEINLKIQDNLEDYQFDGDI